MIVSVEHRFIFLSMPKCASSAIYRELRREAQIAAHGRPPLKHTPYRALERFVLPYLTDRLGLTRTDFRVLCLFREPIDWLHSWYRYRSRRALRDPAHRSHANYTGEMTFDEFARAWLAESPPSFANVGTQSEFVTSSSGEIGPDVLCRYEEIDSFVALLGRLVGRRLRLRRRKVSPRRPLALDEEIREALTRRLQRDYEIYERIGPV